MHSAGSITVEYKVLREAIVEVIRRLETSLTDRDFGALADVSLCRVRNGNGGAILLKYDELREILDEAVQLVDPRLIDRERSALVERNLISVVYHTERLSIQRRHNGGARA